jgi:serine/threonine protein kinase
MASNDPWDLEPGDEIAPGRRILEPLGRGERYQTYLAFDEHLLTPVVAKVLRADRRDDGRARRGLAIEAELVASLRHPVIVRGFGLHADGPWPHLVLEHLEGPALSSLLRRHGPLPLAQLVPLAVQLGAALHHLRRENLVHLDVKPRNIIMGAPPRLIDLSVARTTRQAAMLDHPVGTDAYMAPEQCRPVPGVPVGPPSDMWGLGATLFEAVAGRRAWRDTDDFPQTVEDPGMLPPDTPMPLVDVIFACLDHDPAARPAPAELVDAVEPLLAAMPRRPVLSRLRPRLVGGGRR